MSEKCSGAKSVHQILKLRIIDTHNVIRHSTCSDESMWLNSRWLASSVQHVMQCPCCKSKARVNHSLSSAVNAGQCVTAA